MGLFSTFFDSLHRRFVYVFGQGARSRSSGRAIEAQEICTSILDCNASYTSRAEVLHVQVDGQGRVSKINRNSPYTRLFEHPNPFMTCQQLLYALSWQLDARNTALAWIDWEGNTPKAIWPLAYQFFNIVQVDGGGYAVEFTAIDGDKHLLWLDDMVVLTRHFDGSGVTGRGNDPISHAISLVDDLDDSMASAVKVSNRIHGAIRTKKAMLAPDAVKKSQEEFKARVEAAASGGGGIVTMDATEDYVPFNTNTWTANRAQMDAIASRLYAYWRTPREVVDNTANEQTMQNYIESVIETRWAQLGQALTNALFTRREHAFGSRIIVFGGAAIGASLSTRLRVIAETKEIGLLTQNEQRELLGYGPVDDGDVRLLSLNYIKSTDQSRYQLGDGATATAEGGEEDETD